ncbi:MAG TPA: ABC transporter substrate-binding protein [Gemmatimonadaceae bacterium]|nr:ABC transporter substrate-binding protein [Gemmatimonadaceae bacterium]
MPRFPQRPRVALAMLLALAAACSRPGNDAARDPASPRIVVVSKQINEFMYELGAEHDIVAKDLTSIYPREIMKLPSVGYHRALSAEGIISMRPTVFLTDGNLGPAAVLTQLRKVGIPIVIMKPGSTVDSAQMLMTALGTRFHHEHAADSIVAQWKQGMHDVLQDTLKWAGKPRPRVLIIHFGQIINNYLAIKRGGVPDQLLRWAGGDNAIDSVGGMARLTPELIAKAQPDIIIATDVGFDRYGSAAKFATMPGVALTPAGKSGRIYKIYEQQIMYYGPRTPAAIREIEGMLHPELASAAPAGGNAQPAAARP